MADKTVQDFMPYWKNDVKYFEEAKIEGKDTRIYWYYKTIIIGRASHDLKNQSGT